MTQQDHEIFLHFLEMNYAKYNAAYLNEYKVDNQTVCDGLWFYGEEGIKIVMTGNSTSINFALHDCNSNSEKKHGSIEVPYETFKPFVDKLYSQISQFSYRHHADYTEYLDEQTAMLNEYLKCYEYTPNTNDNLYDHSIIIPSYHKGEKVEHNLRIGRLTYGSPKQAKTIGFLGCCQVVTTFSVPSTMKNPSKENLTSSQHPNGWLTFDMVLLGTNLVHCPNLRDFVTVSNPANSLQDLMKQLHENKSKFADSFTQIVWEGKIPNKQETTLRKKI